MNNKPIYRPKLSIIVAGFIFWVILFLIYSWARAAYLGRSDWYDADKNWQGDNLMCAYASSANGLMASGWDAGFESEDAIFAWMKQEYPNKATHMVNVYYNWFDVWYPGALSGDPIDTFFGHFNTLDPLVDYLYLDYAVSIGITTGMGYGHALTIWGYELIDGIIGGLWYTDSDDHKEALDYVDIWRKGTATMVDFRGIGSHWIDSVVGLKPASNSVRPSTKTPEPMTFFLVLSGLLILFYKDNAAIRNPSGERRKNRMGSLWRHLLGSN